MARELTPREIAAILEGGTFDRLIEALENQHLECKAAPYQLQDDHHKYELAKDVSSIANLSARTGNDGGYILLGVRTRKLPEYHQDIVVGVSPFDRGEVDPQVYYQVLGDWLIPAPAGIDIRWYPSAATAGRGIVGIWIPRQPAGRWPIILRKVVEGSSAVSGSWIAYFERRSAHAVPLSPQEFQLLLRDGLAAQQEGQAVPPPLASPSQAWQSHRNRRDQAMAAAGLNGVPTFALTAVPRETVHLPTLFRGANDPLVQLLKRPPALRPGGFGLPPGDARIVNGQLRRTVFPGRMLLDCWRDGTLIFATEATEYLCWAMQTPKPGGLRINPLVLVESTYVFAMLAQQIYTEHATPRPDIVGFELLLYAVESGGRRALLTPHRLSSLSTSLALDAKEAPTATHEISVQAAAPWTPGLVAYQLLAAFYAWFGFEEDAIPYTAEENSTRVISKDELLRDGSRGRVL